MRVVLGITAALAAAVLTVAPASAQADTKNCGDFASQAAAQAYFDADPSDPSGLDGDGDRYACESTFGEPSATPGDTVPTQDAGTPSGGVDTGFGGLSGGDDSSPAVPLAVGIAAAAIAGAWTRLRRRSVLPR
ncbi:MAG: excalibur calcium-binding protein [Ilumatobacteraceae bacterium]|nr:excalibur calcium-binding protein [Ilumatobacteraceae bacterium]